MEKTRLEAFSDGVLAIIITIMVLEIKVPHGTDFNEVIALWPKFLSYLLSFIYIGIYWNNHHHMMHCVQTINGAILWANLHLLFWLSLLPFSTGWWGENNVSRGPVSLYSINLLLCAVAFSLLQKALISHQGKDGLIARAVSHDFKGKVSFVMYAAGVLLALFTPWAWLGLVCVVGVAALWVIPDRRMERILAGHGSHPTNEVGADLMGNLFPAPAEL